MTDNPAAGSEIPPPAQGITIDPPRDAPNEAFACTVNDRESGIAARREASVRFDRMLHLLEQAHIPIVLVIAFLLASYTVRNSDFWMHLATGKKIAAGEYKFFGVGNDPFGYGTESMRWVNHAWLFDLLVYAIWSVGHGTAVVVAKAMIVVLLAAVLFLTCRPAREERIAPGTKANPVGWFAAIFVTLALIAAAPRLLLQPVVLSYLFLGLTIWIVSTQSESRPIWRLPVLVGGLFVVWVNCDGWFILGPLVLALFLVGEVLQKLAPGGSQTRDWSSVRNIGLACVVGTAACLINPDFHNAFQLPVELYSPEIPQEFRTDAHFRGTFMSPLDSAYTAHPRLGRTPAAIAYALLLVAGLAAFALNLTRLRWPQVLLAVGFALVSLRTWRAIPFFAIVAAPIIVRNLHDWFLRRSERTFEEAEPEAAGPISAVPHRQSAGVALTPARLVAFLGLTGRLLTLTLALVGGVLAYFGRLHTNPNYISHAQPATWTVAPDPSIERAVRQLQQWRESGKLPADARGLHLHPEIANYCAWFAPGEKSFLDYRIHFFQTRTSDYARARRELQRSLGGEVPEELARIFRKHGIGHIAITWTNDSELADWMMLTANMYLNNEDWTLWQTEGRVSMAGWNGVSHPPDLKVDFVRQAFGPQAARIPAPPKGRLIPSEDGSLQWPTPWENYINPIKPEPTEAITSTIYLMLNAEVGDSVRNRIRMEFVYAGAAAVAGLVCDGTLWSIAGRYYSNAFVESAIVNKAWMREDILAALPLLAVRAARQAMANQPDDPLPYFALSEASQYFRVGSSVPATQVIGVLRQGLARVAANEERKQGYERTTTESYLKLVNNYLNPQFGEGQSLDLAAECLREALKRFASAPPRRVPADQVPEHEKQLANQLKALEEQVRKNQDNFILGSKGKPLQLQVYIARQMGLTREALRVLSEHRLNLERPEEAFELIRLHLLLGQVEVAQNYLNQMRVEDLSPQHQGQMRLLQVETYVASGHLEKAGQELEKVIQLFQGQISQLPLSLEQVVFGQLAVGFVDPSMSPFTRDLMGMFWAMSFQGVTMQSWQAMASLCAQRGMIALEEGDNVTALKYLQKAVDIRVYFDGRQYAERYLELLKREAAK